MKNKDTIPCLLMFVAAIIYSAIAPIYAKMCLAAVRGSMVEFVTAAPAVVFCVAGCVFSIVALCVYVTAEHDVRR